MYTDLDKELILKFLVKNYPVVRYKCGHKFKRAIVLDGGTVYQLTDVHNHLKLKFELIAVLKQVFNFDELILSAVLSNFLPIK